MTEPTTHKAETHCGPRWDFYIFKDEISIMDLKPVLSYEKQIERLTQIHNLVINDKETAIDILNKVNYYRLSGYGIGLTQGNDKERYQDGIPLEHLYELYKFDSELKNKLVHLVEQIEIQLRTQIAYLLAMKYGAEGYTDVTNFSDKTNKQGQSIHKKILDKFHTEADRQRNAPFVKHHFNKYNGHFPIWVAIELFTFGNLSSLYSIMKTEDKKSIAQLYKTKVTYLQSWILALVEIRNICAHYGRLYNMPLKQHPRLHSEYSKYQSTSSVTKLFPSLIALKRMFFSNSQWADFESQLEKLIDDNKAVVKLDFMGFPSNWKEILE